MAGEGVRGAAAGALLFTVHNASETGFTQVGNYARDEVNIKKQVTKTSQEENRT